MMKRTALSMVVALALGFAATSAFAGSTPAAEAPASQKTAQVATNGATPVVKPGDPTCIRNTGSHIPPAKGHCLPVAGRSYTGQQIRNTGQIDTARALQMLDPSISIGNGW